MKRREWMSDLTSKVFRKGPLGATKGVGALGDCIQLVVQK